jgi:hypothetical protein
MWRRVRRLLLARFDATGDNRFQETFRWLNHQSADVETDRDEYSQRT